MKTQKQPGFFMPKKSLISGKTAFFLFLLLMGLALISCSDDSSSHDELAQCLTENEVTMYGTEWCPHCQNQKAAFGDSFGYIDYVDCDKNPEACQSAGVQGYPTWVIDGVSYPGEQQLSRLASLAGCA